MEYKKKLKTRLYISFVYIILGLLMIVSTFITKTDNDFISSFGFSLLIMAAVRIRNYRMITKNEATVRKQQIIETDERRISIIYKARSTAFYLHSILLSLTVIVLSFFGLHDIARWIAFSIILLVVIYWICYLVYEKRT